MRSWHLLPLLLILVTACAPALGSASGSGSPPETAPGGASQAPDPASPSSDTQVPEAVEGARRNRRVEDTQDYAFASLLPFDGINPIYDPEFVPAQQAPLSDDELVIGIALEGEAKAYPITVLRFREMVNDELAGIPILVTW